MNMNPCSECFLKNKDKNNETCKACYKRINYVKRLDESLGFTASYAFDTFALHSVSNT